MEEDFTEHLLTECLKLIKSGLFPGKGEQSARLVRDVCDFLGKDENDYLPKYVIQNKREWGLAQR